MDLHHVIEAQQFDVPTIMQLIETTREMEKVVARGGTPQFRGRIMATLFYEPSTRTRFSFESAMHRLGGSVVPQRTPRSSPPWRRARRWRTRYES